MLRKLVLGASVFLLPLGLVVAAAPGVASAASNPPKVTHVAPHHGPASGGTSVAIIGSNFTGAIAVDFGSHAAKTFAVVSGRVIVAQSPAGTGTVDVTVTTPSGLSATGTSDEFTYSARLPMVKALVPSHGKPAGGTVVTIIGNNLSGATAVDFGTNPATDVDVFSGHVITAESPAGSGVVDVTVTTPLGTSNKNRKDEFTYNSDLPQVTRVTPVHGSPTGGTTVAIRGSNFTGATAVDFGSNPATGVVVITKNLIAATTPAGTGTVDVTVTTPAGTSQINQPGDEFIYEVVTPVVTHVAPHKGPAVGGTVVAIIGQHLHGATAVDFGTNAATGVNVISDKIVLATSPAGSVGTVDVTVTTPLGTTATSSKDQFTYK